jgi:hypothetical protein
MITLLNQQPCIRNLYSKVVTSADGSTGEYTLSITETLFGFVVGETLYFNGNKIAREDWKETEIDIIEEANFLSSGLEKPEWAEKLEKEMAKDTDRRVKKFLIGIHD